MMNRLTVAPLVLAVLLATPAIALAAAPANDDLSDAVSIGALPFDVTVDLSEATTEPDEDVSSCYPSAHTVWYVYEVPEPEILTLDISGSDPDVGMRVYYQYSGTGPALGNCNSSAYPTTWLNVAPGLTLYLQVTSPDAPATAHLAISSEPRLEVTATLDGGPAKVDLKTGNAQFTGTVTCNKPARAGMTVDVIQRQGRQVIRTWGNSEEVDCGPLPSPVVINTYYGAFVPGSVEVTFGAQAVRRTPPEEFDTYDGPASVKIKLAPR
jgi:hypothetical protein